MRGEEFDFPPAQVPEGSFRCSPYRMQVNDSQCKIVPPAGDPEQAVKHNTWMLQRKTPCFPSVRNHIHVQTMAFTAKEL